MSKQLAIASAAAVFAMSVFALFTTTGGEMAGAEMLAGAKVETPAPALIRIAPVLSD